MLFFPEFKEFLQSGIAKLIEFCPYEQVENLSEHAQNCTCILRVNVYCTCFNAALILKQQKIGLTKENVKLPLPLLPKILRR